MLVNEIMERMNETVNKVYQEFVKAYLQLAKTSHMEALKNLRAGEIAPAEGDLLPEYQNRMTALVDEYSAKALEKIGDAKKKITEIITAAPSEEAIRALSAFEVSCPKEKIDDAMERERIADQIDYLMFAYDNYLIYEAYRALAQTAGIVDFKKHSVEKALENIRFAESFVAKEIGTAVRNRTISQETIPNYYQDFLAMHGAFNR